MGNNVDTWNGGVTWRAEGDEWKGMARLGERAWPVSVRRREPTLSHPHPWIGRVGPEGGGARVYFDDDPLALRERVGRMALFEMEETSRLISAMWRDYAPSRWPLP